MSLSFILALFWFFPFNWYTSCNNDVQNDVYIVKLLRPCKTGNFTLPLHLNEEYKYWGMNVSVPLTIFKILPYYLPACGFTLKSPMAVLLLLIFLSVFHCHDGIYSVKLWVFSILLIFIIPLLMFTLDLISSSANFLRQKMKSLIWSFLLI